MFNKLFGRRKNTLADRCRNYLDIGPPEHMSDYVPESLTETVISHGAENKKLASELLEVASIILMESDDLETLTDPATRNYMIEGANLVKEVLES